MADEGIFLKVDDGDDPAVYFIGEDVLASCRLDGERLEQVEQIFDDDAPDVAGFVHMPTVVGYVGLVQATGVMIGAYKQGPLEDQAAAKEQQAGEMSISPRASRGPGHMRL